MCVNGFNTSIVNIFFLILPAHEYDYDQENKHEYEYLGMYESDIDFSSPIN